MKLCIYTIALDAMPQITWHLPVFNRLTIPWHWYIAEGAAMNVKDTSWCARQEPRLSRDGTTEYLNSIKVHPHVTVIQKPRWEGKVEQCNACLAQIKEPCILLQMDSDECWDAHRLESLVGFFKSYDEIKCAKFYCRYFIGQNIVITSRNTYGNNSYEWLRAWRFEPGMTYSKHEPPILTGCFEPMATREQTEEVGLVFDHYSYVFEKQVAYKCNWYNYPNGLNHWRRLQENKVWPAKVRNFLPWVKDEAVAELLHKL
jgi:hypothetical protein